MTRVSLPLLMLWACGAPADEPVVHPVAAYQPLSPAEQLTRVSVALRGQRPDPADVARVQADPTALAGLVDRYLDDPAFDDTVRDLHAELWQVRIDSNSLYHYPLLGPLEGRTSDQVQGSLMREPLELAAHVVQQDLPYSEILTADYALVDEIVADVWGAEPLPGEATDGWYRATWTDGRPMAGILSSSWLWQRHKSAASNFHRGRAAFLASLMCDDIPGRDIVVSADVDLADPHATADALTGDADCVSCHQTLDPIASSLWGFKRQVLAMGVDKAYEDGCRWSTADPDAPPDDAQTEHFCYPLRFYEPAHEGDWATWGLRAPGWYGQPVDDLTGLGRAMARDDRFARCTAERFYGWFAQNDELPPAFVDELQQVFVDSRLSARALVRHIVLSDAFLAADGTVPDGPTARRLATRPEQLSRTLEQLTGYRWAADPSAAAPCDDVCWTDVDLLTTDLHGFRTLAGGIDGFQVLHPTHGARPTRTLVWERAAVAAAAYAVEQDLHHGAGRLLTVRHSDTDTDRVREQVEQLHLTILGSADGSVEDSVALFYEVEPRSGVEVAWTSVIAALLLSPEVQWH